MIVGLPDEEKMKIGIMILGMISLLFFDFEESSWLVALLEFDRGYCLQLCQQIYQHSLFHPDHQTHRTHQTHQTHQTPEPASSFVAAITYSRVTKIYAVIIIIFQHPRVRKNKKVVTREVSPQYKFGAPTEYLRLAIQRSNLQRCEGMLRKYISRFGH